MKTSYEIVDLYREIGKTFKDMGAEKVVLVNSRTNVKSSSFTEEIFLEIAVEGNVDQKMLEKTACEKWPFLSMDLMVLDESSDQNLVSEIMEDGIFI